MKLIIDATYPVGVDVIGEIAIGAEQPPTISPLAVGVEMHDLTRGMHAGVGAPGTGGCDGLVGNNAQRLFDALLNATPVVLTLPAIVSGTVVFNADGDSHIRVLRGAVKVARGGMRASLGVNRVVAAPVAAGSHRPHRGLP